MTPPLGLVGFLGVEGVWDYRPREEEENIIWHWLRINLSLTLVLVHNSQCTRFFEHQFPGVKVLNEDSILQLQGIGESL